MWSFKDRVLLPHSPSNYLTWKLDRDYSPLDAKWHSIDKFFHAVTKGDSSLRNLLIAACAAVLQGRADLQKAFYLFGSGANGKGSFMRLLEMLVGDENTHSTSLENICENRFEVANLHNKRLVICPDEDRRIRGLSVFKSVTGGDSIRGEEKGMKAFKFKFQGTIVIASNNPIFMGDDSYGLSRRLIPIPFPKKIHKSERRDLTAEFTRDLPAFTTYLLGIDRDWVTTTLRQANDLKAIKDLEWELTIRTDSIAAFYEEKLIFDPESTISAAQIYGVYKQFCSDTGFAPKHQNNFCPSLVNLLVDKLEKDVTSRKTMTGKQLKGLRLRNPLDSIDDSYDDYDGYDDKKQNVENNSSPMTAMTTMTTMTAIDDFHTEIDPQPPTIDRSLPERGDRIRISDYIDHVVNSEGIIQIDLAFHHYKTAKAWESLIILWGGHTERIHRVSRNGKKYMLVVKGLIPEKIDWIMNANLMQPPELQQPKRR